MKQVEMTGFFTCLREKTWGELTVANVDQMAQEFVGAVRRALDEREGYLESSRFLEELRKRLGYWSVCHKGEHTEERSEKIFFRR